jgi:hypothetical protein
MMAVLAWVTLVIVIINHCFVFLRETGFKYHNNGLLAYYGVLAIWFSCIVFFFIFDAASA